MRALFEPTMYEPITSQEEKLIRQLVYLDQVLSLLDGLCNATAAIGLSEAEFMRIQSLVDYPWTEFEGCLTQKTQIRLVYGHFLRLIDYDFIQSAYDCIPLTDIKHSSSNDCCYYAFLHNVALLKDSFPVFLGIANHGIIAPVQFQCQNNSSVIFSVNTIGDIEDQDVMYFSEGFRALVLADCRVQPTLTNKFPNARLCTRYLELCQKAIQQGNDKIASIRRIANEVAFRNNYIRDAGLSAMNSSNEYIRDIYRSEDSEVFLCTDVRHGCFEAFDRRGTHLGEYGFDGTFHHGSVDSTGAHNIRV